MAHSMRMVEENLSGNYELDEMTDETKASSIRLCSLLISYLRNRPLKLIRRRRTAMRPGNGSYERCSRSREHDHWLY